MAQETAASGGGGPAAVEAAGLGTLWRQLLFFPTLGFLVLLAIVPLLFSLGISLFDYALGSKPIWVGLGNYIRLFTNSQFWMAARVTVGFTIVAVSIEVVLGLLLAVALNQRLTGMGVIRLIVFLPMMLAPFCIGLFWRFMLNRTFGIIDYLLVQIGLPAIPWLTDPFWARVAVVIVDVWQWTPFVALLMLAGLGTIPNELKEAAALDRAPVWMRFRQVYWPYLRFPLLLALLFRSIDTLKLFDTPFILTGGGPGNFTTTLSILGYRHQIMFFNVGMAAAVSWIVVVIINVVTTILLQLIQPTKVEKVHTGL